MAPHSEFTDLKFILDEISSPDDLWCKFKSLYVDQLETSEDLEFEAIYNSYHLPETRTNFNAKILGTIAPQLGLSLQEEFLRIDFAYTKRPASGWDVPLIFVEHENNIIDTNEIQKLCATHAPLKVFIVWMSGSWMDERKEWLDEDWMYMVNSFLEVHSELRGKLALIIAECNSETKSIKYHCELFDGNARQFINEGIFFEFYLEAKS
jgi:hypothetical protein